MRALPTPAIWAIVLGALLVLGLGAGATWWLVAGRGDDTPASSSSPEAEDEPAEAPVEPLSEADAAATVFVGEELESLLLTEEEFAGVHDLGDNVPYSGVGNELLRTFGALSYSPGECGDVDGEGYTYPGGYRASGGGDPSYAEGGFSQEALQFGTVDIAAEQFARITAAVDGCSEFSREDTEMGYTEYFALTAELDDAVPLPSVLVTTTESQGTTRQLLVTRIGNVLLKSSFTVGSADRALSAEDIAVLKSTLRDRALLAAASVGVGDDR